MGHEEIIQMPILEPFLMIEINNKHHDTYVPTRFQGVICKTKEKKNQRKHTMRFRFCQGRNGEEEH